MISTGRRLSQQNLFRDFDFGEGRQAENKLGEFQFGSNLITGVEAETVEGSQARRVNAGRFEARSDRSVTYLFMLNT